MHGSERRPRSGGRRRSLAKGTAKLAANARTMRIADMNARAKPPTNALGLPAGDPTNRTAQFKSNPFSRSQAQHKKNSWRKLWLMLSSFQRRKRFIKKRSSSLTVSRDVMNSHSILQRFHRSSALPRRLKLSHIDFRGQFCFDDGILSRHAGAWRSFHGTGFMRNSIRAPHSWLCSIESSWRALHTRATRPRLPLQRPVVIFRSGRGRVYVGCARWRGVRLCAQDDLPGGYATAM